MLADDIILADESRDVVNVEFDRWWDVLESKVLKISCTKIEYMDYNFRGPIQRIGTTMRIED